MTKSPQVSVVIPTYNRAHLVGRAIRSVLGQTFVDLELLVVDDASTDDTEDVVAGFQDSRMRYLRQETNQGAPAARNRGIREARGEYIGFLDSDDEWLPVKLEKQLEVFRSTQSSDLTLVSCGRRYVWPDGSERVVQPLQYGPPRADILFERQVGIDSTGTFLIKREAGHPLLFEESLPALQDWEFLIRAAEKGSIESVAEPLLIRHMHEGDHIHNLQNVYQARKIVLGKYLAELREYPKGLAAHYFRTATSAGHLGQRSDCISFMLRSIIVWPWDWRMYLRVIGAMLGVWPSKTRQVINR